MYFRARHFSPGLGRFTGRNSYYQSIGSYFVADIFDSSNIVFAEVDFMPQFNFIDGPNWYISGVGLSQGIDPSGNPGDELKWITYLVDKYGLSQDGRRALHDLITKQGYSKGEIVEEAKELARQGGKWAKSIGGNAARRGASMLPSAAARLIVTPAAAIPAAMAAGAGIGAAAGYGIHKLTPDPSVGGTGAGCGSKGNFSGGTATATAWGSKRAMEEATQAAMAACAAMTEACNGGCCPSGKTCVPMAGIDARNEYPSSMGFSSTAMVTYYCYCGCK